MNDTKKKNLTNPKTWLRLVYIILFAIAFNVAEVVIVAVVVAQFLFELITGRSNEQLRSLGRSLGGYANEIIAYLTYHSDDKPFPFGSWPEGAPAREPAKAKAAAKPARARRSRKPKAPEPEQLGGPTESE
jgi:hypothetical protein